MDADAEYRYVYGEDKTEYCEIKSIHELFDYILQMESYQNYLVDVSLGRFTKSELFWAIYSQVITAEENIRRNDGTAERRRFQIDSDDYWGRHYTPEDGTLILSPGYDDALETPDYDRSEKPRGERQQFQPKIPEPGAGKSDAPEPTPEDNNDSYEEELDSAIDRLLDLIETMESRSPQQAELLERIWKGVGAARLEWRTILDQFLQEEVNDYSFLPPDRRFADSGFFLPDFNQTERSLKDVLFMVDSSGSVSSDTIADIYGEICAAIEQYDGTLQGKLSFFDTQVTTPVPFGSIQQLLKIRPGGNGGTDFGCIFRYINRSFENDPSCIVIITDGLGEYPAEEAARGIPVLWVLYGDAPFPFWGKHARIPKGPR